MIKVSSGMFLLFFLFAFLSFKFAHFCAAGVYWAQEEIICAEAVALSGYVEGLLHYDLV